MLFNCKGSFKSLNHNLYNWEIFFDLSVVRMYFIVVLIMGIFYLSLRYCDAYQKCYRFCIIFFLYKIVDNVDSNKR